MAQTIKLKRSATQNAVPSTSQLALGEVAINTYDGKMYIKKNDGSDSIVEIGGDATSSSGLDFTGNLNLADDVRIVIGDGNDLQIWHGGVDSYVRNYTGNLQFIQGADDKDIQFYCDDGSGGHAEYLRMDGSAGTIVASKNLHFGDNVFLNMGADNDLQIFHNGSNSVIKDAGTGNLSLQTNGSTINMWNSSAQNYIGQFNANAVTLYHGGNEKFKTTSTGATVTGTMLADAGKLTGSGFTTLTVNSTRTSGNIGGMNFTASDTLKGQIFGSVEGELKFAVNGSTEAMRIDAGGRLLINTTTSIDNLSQLHIVGPTSGRAGITLQDGDSTTQKTFFTQDGGSTRFNTQNGTSHGSFVVGGWNGTASVDLLRVTGDGRVGIGTNAPAKELHIASSQPDILLQDTDGTNQTSEITSSGGNLFLGSRNDTANGLIIFRGLGGGTGDEYARFNSNGKLGIGTTSPTYLLDVQSSVGGILARFKDTDSSHTGIVIAGDTNAGWVGNNALATGEGIYYQSSLNAMRMYTNGSEAMRIDSSGRVGIGETSPVQKLQVNGNIRADGHYYVGGLIVIDSSRNLTNIGTVTASGIVNIGGGTSYYSEKLLVQGRTRVAGQLDIAAGTGYGNYAKFTHDDTELEIATVRSAGTNGQIVLSPLGTAALTLDTSQNATFAGNITMTGNQLKIISSTDSNLGWMIRDNTYVTDEMDITSTRLGTGNQPTLGLAGQNGINFYVAGTNVGSFNSSGHLLVGKSSTGVNTNGIEARTDGLLAASRDQNPALYVTRTTDAGDIAKFYSGTTSVGSIGTINNILTIGSGSTGIIFNPNASPNASIYPWNVGTNSASDSAIDLGISTRRWQDLYLSGTIYGGSTLTLDPAAHGDDTGTVVIAGNLQVDGTTTTINSTTLTVDDKNITLASGSTNAAAANGAGLTVDCGSDADATLTYVSGGDRWQFNKELRVTEGSSSVAFNEYNNGATIWLDGSNGDFAGGDYFNISAYGTTDLAFGYGAGTKITMKNDGKLGIGTTSPSSLLHLSSGSSPSLRIQDTTQNATFVAYAQDSNVHIGTSSNHPLIVDVNNTERLRIDSNGRVGIGTDSPSQKLDVEGLIRSGGIAHPEIELVPTGSLGNADIRFDGTSLDIRSNSSGAYLTLQTSTTERLKITNTGNFEFNNGNFTEVGTISSGAITVNGGTYQSVIKSSSDAPLILESTDAYSGINFKDPDGNSSMYYRGTNDHLYLHSAKFSVAGSTLATGYQFQVNGSANLTGSLAIGGTTVIDSSRNITAGTISSGEITTTDDINISSGKALRFGSYDYIKLDDDSGTYGGGTNRVTIASISNVVIHADTNGNGPLGEGFQVWTGSTPEKRFEALGERTSVFGTLASPPTIRLSNTTTGFTQGDNVGQIEFYHADPTDFTPGAFGIIRGVAGASGGEGSIQVLTNMPSEGTDANDVAIEFTGAGAVKISDAFTLPTSDGSGNQVLQTDGSGNVTWATVQGVGAPTYMEDADGDTKIQVEESADEDKIRFDTAGTQRMVIDDQGRVGINTASLSKTLTVGGTFSATGEAFFSHFDNTTNASRMRDDLRLNFGTARTFAITGNSTNMHMKNGTTDVMTFDTSNRVGIGTTSPTQKLQVAGTILADTALTASSGTHAIGIGSESNITDTSSTYRIKLLSNANNAKLTTYAYSSYLTLKAGVDGTNYANNWSKIELRDGGGTGSNNAHMKFYTHGDERMVIDNYGNVGIGTNNPVDNYATDITPESTKLAVVGANVSGYTEVAHFAAGTDSDNTGATVRIGHLGNDRGMFIKAGRGTSNQAKALLGVRDSGNADSNILTLQEGGRVGIGTTTPDTKLDIDGLVNGGIAFTSTQVEIDRQSVLPNGRIFYNDSRLIYDSPANGHRFAVAGNQGSNLALEIYSNRDIGFYNSSGAADLFWDASTSRLGIGTTSPSAALHVKEEDNITTTVETVGDFFPSTRIKRSGGSTKTNYEWEFQIGSSGNLNFKDITNSYYPIILNTAGDVRLSSNTSGQNPVMFVQQSTARVGIGETSPAHNLEVSGDGHLIRATGTTAGGSARIGVYNESDGNGNAGALVYLQSSGHGEGFLHVGSHSISATGGDFNIRAGSGLDLTFGNGTTEYARISGAGNVGIGTNSPQSFCRLDVRSTSASSAAGIAAYGYASNGTAILGNGYAGSAAGTNYGIRGLSTGPRGSVSGSVNVGGHFQASGAVNNYALTTGAGNVGIGTSAPTNKFHVYEPVTNVVARFESGDSQVWIDLHDSNSGTYGAILGHDGNAGQLFMVADAGVNRRFIIDTSGQVSIGTNVNPVARLQVEALGIDTTTTSTSATTQVAIDTMAAATFRSAKYTIQVTNSTDSTYHITEILLIHDGTTPGITEYGTVFTGSAAEATFDADISSGNVRLLATPASTDSMTFKVVRHCITV